MSGGRFRPGGLLGSGVRRIIVVVFAVAGVAMVLFPAPAHVIVRTASAPLADLVAIPMEGMAILDRGIRDWWLDYVDLRGVREQNRALRNKVQQLEGDLNQWRERMLASERLSALLEFQQHAPIPTMAAKVIGRSASNWYQGVILNKGEQDGVRIEMGVMTAAGVVGHIVRTGRSTSVALLIIDPNVAVGGLVQRTRDEGVVQGTAQGHVRMKYLPPLASVTPGDAVITSGLVGGFPRGVLIGRVSRVGESEGELFQVADIEPAVPFRQLEEVLIVLATQPSDVEMTLGPAGGAPASPEPAP